MMRSSLVIFVSIIALSFNACTGGGNASLEELNLLQHGLPLTIMAPDSAKVTVDALGMSKDVSVKKGEDFSINILASDAYTTDVKQLKTDELGAVKEGRYFSKVVKEDNAGFIYETMIDSTEVSYGFVYMRVKGDREYKIQNGAFGQYTLEQIENMYDAVKPVKR